VGGGGGGGFGGGGRLITSNGNIDLEKVADVAKQAAQQLEEGFNRKRSREEEEGVLAGIMSYNSDDEDED